jgi:hypothetical protein
MAAPRAESARKSDGMSRKRRIRRNRLFAFDNESKEKRFLRHFFPFWASEHHLLYINISIDQFCFHLTGSI